MTLSSSITVATAAAAAAANHVPTRRLTLLEPQRLVNLHILWRLRNLKIHPKSHQNHVFQPKSYRNHVFKFLFSNRLASQSVWTPTASGLVRIVLVAETEPRTKFSRFWSKFRRKVIKNRRWNQKLRSEHHLWNFLCETFCQLSCGMALLLLLLIDHATCQYKNWNIFGKSSEIV